MKILGNNMEKIHSLIKSGLIIKWEKREGKFSVTNSKARKG